MKSKISNLFNSIIFETPIGTMIAIANDQALHLLEFSDQKGLEKMIKLMQGTEIIKERNQIIDSIESEINLYFQGSLKEFKTPIELTGTPFQKSVWETLIPIPYAQTRSYLEQAKIIENPSAYRAVANANSANKLAMIIPCHRIIHKNGDLGGYAGGVTRKKWLIEHERKHQ